MVKSKIHHQDEALVVFGVFGRKAKRRDTNFTLIGRISVSRGHPGECNPMLIVIFQPKIC